MDQDQVFDAADMNDETVDSNSSVSDTPGGTRYWTPKCAADQRPSIGQKFDSLKAAIEFYNCYASICGFSVRLGTGITSKDGTVTIKHLLCSNQGFKWKNETSNHSPSIIDPIDMDQRITLPNRLSTRLKLAGTSNLQSRSDPSSSFA